MRHIRQVKRSRLHLLAAFGQGRGDQHPWLIKVVDQELDVGDFDRMFLREFIKR